MDQERNEVREVEDARQRVADDVRSVAENANVVERAKENVRGRIEDVKGSVGDRVSDVRDRLQGSMSGVGENVGSMAQSVRNNVGNLNPMENPLAMLIGGIAVGFLIGMLLPVTRFESERIGPITDDLKDRVRQTRDEVVRRGGEVIKETIDASKQAAMSSLRDQAGDMGIGGGSESEL